MRTSFFEKHSVSAEDHSADTLLIICAQISIG